MTGSGACSSFSVATTVFVSLAICAVISYGVFYYFKQRLARIEHSQMEQARIMQAIISRGLAAQQSTQSMQSTQPTQPTQPDQKSSQKEITITQSSLIEVSSDEDEESASSPESESEDSNESDDSDESSESKWSIGDEIHQADGYHEEFTESFKKNILIDAICIDSGYQVESVTIENANANANADNTEESQHKKIISLNRGALNNHDDDSDHDDDDDDSSSSEDQDQVQDHVGKEHKDNDVQEFELKIGYKPSSNKAMQLNYGNMSVSALRQLAKERGLGGEEGDLQKLKKKDLVQLLQ
jgi:hypothetical protein